MLALVQGLQKTPYLSHTTVWCSGDFSVKSLSQKNTVANSCFAAIAVTYWQYLFIFFHSCIFCICCQA